MLHQGQGEAESPEMDWDYYGVQDQTGGQPQYVRGVHNPGRSKGGEKRISKKSCFYTFGGGILFSKLQYFWTLCSGKAIFMRELSEKT